MRSGLYAKKILTFFFLLCFSIYAVSPLAGTVQQSGSLADGINRHSVGIFLIQFLLSDVLNDNSDNAPGGQDDPFDDHCLIKKKKAILSKDHRSIITLYAEQHVSAGFGLTVPAASVKASVPRPGLHIAQDALVLLHSPNAPPAV